MGATLRCAYAPLDVRGCTVNQLINHNETQFRIHKHTHTQTHKQTRQTPPTAERLWRRPQNRKMKGNNKSESA